MKCNICGKELVHMEGNYYFAHKHREINPEYRRLAQLAYNTVLQTMIEGEKTHSPDGWKNKPICYHKLHASEHADSAYIGDDSEDHIAHAMTCCAMIKYLEDK